MHSPKYLSPPSSSRHLRNPTPRYASQFGSTAPPARGSFTKSPRVYRPLSDMPQNPGKKRRNRKSKKQPEMEEHDATHAQRAGGKSRPWGRGRYTSKRGGHTGQGETEVAYYEESVGRSAGRYSDSLRLPIAELVESDDGDVSDDLRIDVDTSRTEKSSRRRIVIVENYDLRSLDPMTSASDAARPSVNRSLVSLDREEGQAIHDRWERAAMLQSMRSEAVRSQGHVCVCRVCAEILLLPGNPRISAES